MGVSGTVLHLDFLWLALLPDNLGPKVLTGPKAIRTGKSLEDGCQFRGSLDLATEPEEVKVYNIPAEGLLPPPSASLPTPLSVCPGHIKRISHAGCDMSKKNWRRGERP